MEKKNLPSGRHFPSPGGCCEQQRSSHAQTHRATSLSGRAAYNGAKITRGDPGKVVEHETLC